MTFNEFIKEVKRLGYHTVDKQLSREKKEDLESRNIPTADFINIVVWGKHSSRT